MEVNFLIISHYLEIDGLLKLSPFLFPKCQKLKNNDTYKLNNANK